MALCGAHVRWFPPKLSPANAGLLCVHTSAIGSTPDDIGTIEPLVGGMGGVGIGGWFMGHVLSLQLARERGWRLRGGSKGPAFERLGPPLWNSEITGLDERKL